MGAEEQRGNIENIWLKKYRFLEYVFMWLRLFYPRARGIPAIYLLAYFIPQKIFRINGSVKWPVHFTSRVMHPGNIEVGNRTAPGISSGSYIQAKNGIRLGSNVRLGPNVGLISANHSNEDYDEWVRDRPIKIGDNVWLGMNVVVMPGVEIGNNVVIGSNSVVTKDVPSDCIAFGNPCRVVKAKSAYTGFDYTKL